MYRVDNFEHLDMNQIRKLQREERFARCDHPVDPWDLLEGMGCSSMSTTTAGRFFVDNVSSELVWPGFSLLQDRLDRSSKYGAMVAHARSSFATIFSGEATEGTLRQLFDQGLLRVGSSLELLGSPLVVGVQCAALPDRDRSGQSHWGWMHKWDF
jgi:hypothetical protein